MIQKQDGLTRLSLRAKAPIKQPAGSATKCSGKQSHGYTITELVLAIALLGVVLLFAMPRYIEKSKEGERILRDLVVTSVRAGLVAIETAPEQLDLLPSNTRCSVETPCFTKVIPEGVTLEQWEKVSATHYQFYRGAERYQFVYDPSNKTFSLSKL